MKVKAAAVSLVLATTLLAGCAANPSATPGADIVATASIVNNEAAFEKAIARDGSWIAGIFKDLNFTKDLVLEGEFRNNGAVARKIALYTQDANRQVADRFTLRAPKLTIKSENALIQGGTFVGDLYIQAKNFQLIDAIVEGNVYFVNDDAKETYRADAKSSVTGKIELKK